MLNIGNKTFMNLQEAVGWLLENNALPFQSTANYVANTEIAMSTLVNPSPAKVRVGSLIFFADSIVSTVIGVTSNSFIVSDQYNSLVDDITYVSNVEINASDHLICTLSNGDTIDAGLIKQVTGFVINASQHLVANYNDGTSTDLGAIFSGNVNIAGNFTADSIIENMSGYSASLKDTTGKITPTYVSVVKNGNKITFVVAGEYLSTSDSYDGQAIYLVDFDIPSVIGAKLYPMLSGTILDSRKGTLMTASETFYDCAFYTVKANNIHTFASVKIKAVIPANTKCAFRYECTFLLNDSLI